MPYKHETKRLRMRQADDRRRKLTNAQREAIRANALGLSQRALAIKYKVSRRLIQFILDPLKHEENLLRRKERGGSAQYYEGGEVWAETMREHRRYKRKLDLEGRLYE